MFKWFKYKKTQEEQQSENSLFKALECSKKTELLMKSVRYLSAVEDCWREGVRKEYELYPEWLEYIGAAKTKVEYNEQK